MTFSEFMSADPRTLMGLPAEKSVCDCVLCTKPITGAPSDDVHDCSDGPAHGDCYFQALGEVVEALPPRGRGPRRAKGMSASVS